MERMRSRSTIKSVSAVIGKRERKVPVRHLDFISDEHLEPESDDDGPPQKMRGGRGDFYCTHCPAHYPTRTGLANHTKQHGSMKKYRCEECDMSCDSLKTLRVHSQVHIPDDGDQPLISFTQHSNKVIEVEERRQNHHNEVVSVEKSLESKATDAQRGSAGEGSAKKPGCSGAVSSDLSSNIKYRATEMLEPNNVMGKRMVRSSTDVAAYVSSATTSPTVIPLCREVQHTTEKSNFTALLPARTASSLRFKKSSGRTFDNQRRKPSIHHQQRSFKGIAASRMAKYKCFCCHARFFTNYERSAHRSLCRRAPKIAKSLYTALLKERVDAFKRDEKHP
ncbi:unnamed protein product [Toxocara canis]|uniref:C2H2-type domain-containing protein n=1 Tax=Toxocara canis TaxID=6265 RepID=A0A183V7M6_TOXCA|nr:unnamed protein product [Toxocara canis]